MKLYTKTLFLVVVYFSTTQAEACFKYSDPTVSIVGKVIMRTFSGPPGFGETPKQDAKERQALLILDAPLCVDASEDEDAETNQAEITLVPLNQMSFSKLVGKKIAVTGSLFHAITGHHHTPVLIEIFQQPTIVK